MKEKFMKKIVILAMVMLILTPVFAVALPAKAAPQPIGWGQDVNGTAINNDTIADTMGLGKKDPRTMAASVINIMLGFLGIIAVVIILLAGFKWMTAGGNEEKVGEAKKLMAAGVIGLIIVLAAYAIANFVVSQLIDVTVNG